MIFQWSKGIVSRPITYGEKLFMADGEQIVLCKFITTTWSKKVWVMLKSHQFDAGRERGGDGSHKRGTFFIGKAGSHYVLLLYCETLWQVLLGIYCKRFYWIPLFTILLLFNVCF